MLADSNFWLALSLTKHTFHNSATIVFTHATPASPVLFCRLTQLSFVRLLTTEAITKPYGIPPVTNRDAWSMYEAIRGDSRCGFVQEPPGIEGHWKQFASHNMVSPKVWMDAYLAAFAVTGGHKLVTTDKGFKQFKGLSCTIL